LNGDRRVGVESKRADAPTLTPSMRIAMSGLKLGALSCSVPEASATRWAIESTSCRRRRWLNSGVEVEERPMASPNWPAMVLRACWMWS